MYSKLMNLLSNGIGDASFIGLECESGDFSDCNLDEFDGDVWMGCEDILIFSNSNSTCGSLCNPKLTRRSASKNGNEMNINKAGWTLMYMSADKPSGTGDHEHYGYYKRDDILIVYDQEGQAWQNCKKRAILVRERKTHLPWWNLSSYYTLLFSKDKKYYTDGYIRENDKEIYQTSLKPDYG